MRDHWSLKRQLASFHQSSLSILCFWLMAHSDGWVWIRHSAAWEGVHCPDCRVYGVEDRNPRVASPPWSDWHVTWQCYEMLVTSGFRFQRVSGSKIYMFGTPWSELSSVWRPCISAEDSARTECEGLEAEPRVIWHVVKSMPRVKSWIVQLYWGMAINPLTGNYMPIVRIPNRGWVTILSLSLSIYICNVHTYTHAIFWQWLTYINSWGCKDEWRSIDVRNVVCCGLHEFGPYKHFTVLDCAAGGSWVVSPAWIFSWTWLEIYDRFMIGKLTFD